MPTRRPSVHHTKMARRQRLYACLQEHPIAGVKAGEIDAHFATMPARYWDRVTKSELIWGLETVAGFFERASTPATSLPVVVADSRHYPERSVTKTVVCSWDRPGLLAKIAAAFTALRVNILRADVYTRSDGVALDLFEVASPECDSVAEADRLRHLVFLLEGAMSDPPRFASIWASEFHKTLPRELAAPLAVTFDNHSVSDYTIVRVEAGDRLGLLHDLLRGLAECGLNVAESVVETNDGLASDVFYLSDLKGQQIADPARLEAIRKALARAVAS